MQSKHQELILILILIAIKELENMEKNEHFSPIVLCMIQARMDGKRFPGKVLKNINGIPIISFIIKRASKAKVISKIIVVTSKNKKDDILIEYLKDKILNFLEEVKIMCLKDFTKLLKNIMLTI